MLRSGLVSITLRDLSPSAVVQLISQANLDAVEWHGESHVLPGDVAQARAVRAMTQEAGLVTAAYGSYYRISHAETGPFEAVLESAVELGAPSIRVWAGRQGSADADDAYRQAVVADTRRIADLAAAQNVAIVYEYHNKTLTDTYESARRLLEEVDHPNVWTYWQPPRYSTVAHNLAALDAVAPWLYNVHAFSWHRTTGERMALAEGAADWAVYLPKIRENGAAIPTADRYCMLEFVKDNTADQFFEDAKTLQRWLHQI